LKILTLFFFKQKTAYEISLGLVGSEMCIRDRNQAGFFPAGGREKRGSGSVKLSTKSLVEFGSLKI